jgi:hypothetical protein
MWFEKGINNPDHDFHDIQQMAIDSSSEGDLLVEVGSFLGESMHSLIDKGKKSNKKLKYITVDYFDIDLMCKDDDESEKYHHEMEKIMGNGITPNEWIRKNGPRCMLVEYFNYLHLAKKHNDMHSVIISKSYEAAEYFKDGSVHFCFIDAGHSYGNVTKDLNAWFSKIKYNGLLCGHDWHGEGVRKAVVDFAEKKSMKIYTTASSWILK